MTIESLLKTCRDYIVLSWDDSSVELHDEHLVYKKLKNINKYPEGYYYTVKCDEICGGFGNHLMIMCNAIFDVYDRFGNLIDTTNELKETELKWVAVSQYEWREL